MKRRTWVLGGAAIAAGVAGAGLSWQRFRLNASSDSHLGPDFWSQRFERPEGGELVLDSLRGAPLLLNFWATWCPPCVKEMPLLDSFHRQHQASGWQVLGLAIDSPTPVREFLARRPMSFPIGLAGLAGTELSRTLGNPSGSLPFTVVVRDGGIIDRKLGALDAADLARWVSQGRT
jgi:thiol-disulfide isomerase/thioredoxin